MDVTPQVINEVEFHQKMRGYDPDEVDDFLERVAVAVGQLQDRLQEAAERVAGAERRAAELEARLKEVATRPVAAGAAAPAAAAPAVSVTIPPSVEEEAETIRRTLILAQRTADAAIKEAEESAQRTVQSAQDQAGQLYREAEARATQLVADAETEATRAGEESRQRLVAELISLEEARDSLRADSGILERHLDEQRLRLQGSVAELQRLLDDPSRLRVAPIPTLSEVSRPPAVADALSSEAPSSESADADATGPIDIEQPDRDVEPVGAMAAVPDVIDLATPAASGGVTFTAAEEAEDAYSATSPSEDEAWARFVGDDGPPTQAIELAGSDYPSDEFGEEDDDAYLAELRKAMVDETGGAFAEHDLAGDDRQRLRFGRRR